MMQIETVTISAREWREYQRLRRLAQDIRDQCGNDSRYLCGYYRRRVSEIIDATIEDVPPLTLADIKADRAAREEDAHNHRNDPGGYMYR